MFGLVALTIGIGGVFALVSHVANSETRKFAIMLTLGASNLTVVWDAMRSAIAPVLLGVVIGTVVSAMVAQGVRAFLLGVAPVDIPTYLSAAVAYLGAAIVASLVAVHRLATLDPASTLRRQ
jgi:ABC-type antimicrobial peptide transport system permease subunit